MISVHPSRAVLFHHTGPFCTEAPVFIALSYESKASLAWALKQTETSDVLWLNSLSTSGICWYLLQTIWNQIRPDKTLNSSTPYQLEASADIFCKQFGTRSGLTKCRSWPGSKLFDTLMVFLKEFFEKVDFEKNQQRQKKSLRTEFNREHNFLSLDIEEYELYENMSKFLPNKSAIGYYSAVCPFITHLDMTQIWTEHG